MYKLLFYHGFFLSVQMCWKLCNLILLYSMFGAFAQTFQFSFELLYLKSCLNLFTQQLFYQLKFFRHLFLLRTLQFSLRNRLRRLLRKIRDNLTSFLFELWLSFLFELWLLFQRQEVHLQQQQRQLRLFHLLPF
jgi:hypothetical protein